MSQNTALINPNSLQTYEDFLSAYIQLEETTAIFSWTKADLLNELTKKYGEKSLIALSKDIRQPTSTFVNYVRVARAFPENKRLPNASFTLHFQASFADSYNPKRGEFLTDQRFEWLNKAVDEGWSTRRLIENLRNNRLDNGGDKDSSNLLEGRVILKKIYEKLNELEKQLPETFSKLSDFYSYIENALSR